ncbi:MAG: cupin domain-containing protein [Xanthomonadales bacterium]|nr:cupin domain-containing protein [Xanthomonadales bacterium]
MRQKAVLKPLVLGPGSGRPYPMGRMSAVFKADLEETHSMLSVSEWWLEANSEGPHVHKHPEAHLFYVIEGRLTLYLEGRNWFEAEKGSYIFIPGDTEHGFENRSDNTVGFMSINIPGGFEESMPGLLGYFEKQPLGPAR